MICVRKEGSLTQQDSVVGIVWNFKSLTPEFISDVCKESTIYKKVSQW